MLLSCDARLGGHCSCGHLPREVARALSPLVDDGSITLRAEVDAHDVITCGASNPLRLTLSMQLQVPETSHIRNGIRNATDCFKRTRLNQEGNYLAAPQAFGVKGAAAVQRSLLANFGRGLAHLQNNSGTARSVKAQMEVLAATCLFPSIAIHLDVSSLVVARSADACWCKAVDCLKHIRFRLLFERYLRGSGCAQMELRRAQFWLPNGSAIDAGLGNVLGAVRAWALRAIDLDSVLQALSSTDSESRLSLLVNHFDLRPNDGWLLVAAQLLTCCSGKRLNSIVAILGRQLIETDALRELVALLLVVCSRHNEGFGGLGLRRLYADLLVCNRLLEDAGPQFPIQGLHWPGLRLTGEQVRIVLQDVKPSETLVISAFAGAGKTSTLRMYATLRPHLRFLYICFNVSVREEAQRLFPGHVTCRNAHQLAFAECGFKYRHKLRDELRVEDIMMCSDFRQLVHEVAQSEHPSSEVAEACLASLRKFLNSASPAVTDEHIVWPERCPQNFGVAISQTVRSLWSRMRDTKDNEVLMTHGGYLKLYSLSKPRLRYDVILLDEAQDCNPAIADIVASQNCSKVLVGDGHQAIYGFLGAQDVLKQAKSGSQSTVFQRQLTRCFRFGPNIADVANFLLRAFKQETVPLIGRGQHAGSLIDTLRGGLGNLEGCPEPPFAFIARTNGAVIAMALRANDAGLGLSWVGGIRSYRLDLLLDLCLLAQGQRDRIGSARIRAFASLEAIRAFAQRVDDREILARIELVRRCIPEDLTARLHRLQSNAEQSEAAGQNQRTCKPPDICLATVHKAKGLEWNTVMLADDFASPMDMARVAADCSDSLGAGLTGPWVQEVNALYVAVTRAKHELQLPPGLWEMYSKDAQAVALMEPVSVRMGAPCPFCGCMQATPRMPAAVRSNVTLVPAGSVCGQPICSGCMSAASIRHVGFGTSG